MGFELLTKPLQNKLLNYPRAHIINSQSLNTNMVQLTLEQRTFLVKNFFETGSLKVTRKRFAKRFPERRPLALKTIWERKLFRTFSRMFSSHSTTLNRNKGNSRRQRTGRSEANIETVRGPNDLNEVDALRNYPAFIRRTLHAMGQLRNCKASW